MKIISCLMLLLFITSCDTNTDTSSGSEKSSPRDSAKKDSVIPAILGLFGMEIGIVQSVRDSLYSAATPETAIKLINCNDSLVEFSKSIPDGFRYKVKIKLSVSDNQSDSLNPGSKIKSIAIKTGKIDMMLPKYLLKDLKNVIPCNIKVFESKNKKNLLIYPYGSADEKSLEFIISSSNGKIVRIG